jgi:hypothetical protein
MRLRLAATPGGDPMTDRSRKARSDRQKRRGERDRDSINTAKVAMFAAAAVSAIFDAFLRSRGVENLHAEPAVSARPYADDLAMLGLSEMPATRDDLTAAWRAAARQHHPDVGGNADAFRSAKEAYDRLARTYP